MDAPDGSRRPDHPTVRARGKPPPRPYGRTWVELPPQLSGRAPRAMGAMAVRSSARTGSRPSGLGRPSARAGIVASAVPGCARNSLPSAGLSSPRPHAVLAWPHPRAAFSLDRSAGPRQAGASLPPLGQAKRVVLVRHGQSTWNAEGRIRGSSNASVLTPKDEAQAQTSRQMLLSDSFDACFTSPLVRSRRTAEIIWEGPHDGLIPDSDLREIDLYSFQGPLKHEGKERYDVLYQQWQKNSANFSIDGRYPVRELWDRLRSYWDRILAHEGKSVLVVAHNAVNQGTRRSSPLL